MTVARRNVATNASATAPLFIGTRERESAGVHDLHEQNQPTSRAIDVPSVGMPSSGPLAPRIPGRGQPLSWPTAPSAPPLTQVSEGTGEHVSRLPALCGLAQWVEVPNQERTAPQRLVSRLEYSRAVEPPRGA